MESHRWHQGKFRKERREGRAEKRGARQVEQVETDEAAQGGRIWEDPCANGTCPFCMGDWEESLFERTRMYAAQRGAI